MSNSRFKQTDVMRVLFGHQDLSRNGFDYVDHANQRHPCSAQERQEFRDHLLSAGGLWEINTAAEYILTWDIPDWWNSYGLKHQIETWGGKSVILDM